MDRGNYELARHLAAAGHPVRLVAHRVDADLAGHPGVRWDRVPRPLGHLPGSYFLAARGRRAAAATAAAGGRVVVNGGNCPWADINWMHYVHAAHTPTTAGWPHRRAKVALTHRLFVRAERRAVSLGQVFMCNSARTRHDLVSRLGVSADRCRIIRYGIDPAEFPPVTPADRAAARGRLGWPADGLRAVFVGAMGDHRKGFDLTFAAWQRLSAGGWDVHLTVVGSGAEVATWRRRTAAAGLADRITFLGFRTDVPDLIAASDLMVHPARYEAYGLGVHESLCRGVPSVLTRSAGVAETYTPGLADLLLDDPPTSAALTARLRQWRSAVDEYATAAAGVGSLLRQRTWSDMATDIRQVILTD
jgi:glycosyltransferase involved in cell wall biosynthesis